MSFYKYQEVKCHNNLGEERSIQNLVAAQAVFSKRSNFNDLFDSQVRFVVPGKKELRSICDELKGKEKRLFKERYMGSNGVRTFEKFDENVNNLLDGYYFYCVSSEPDSNLMWSHYASSHSGFCIEWCSKKIRAEVVKYKRKIPRVKVADLIRYNLELDCGTELKRRLWLALRTKLLEWEYENEYRFHLGRGLESLVVQEFEKCVLVQAKPDWIKSVIFGYRMPEATREYIINSMPIKTKFKVAKIGKDLSSIVVKNA